MGSHSKSGARRTEDERGGAEAGRAAECDGGHGKERLVGRIDEVAVKKDREGVAHGGARHFGHDRLGEAAQGFKETARRRVDRFGSVERLAHVGARGEEAGRPLEKDDAHLVVLARGVEFARKLIEHVRVEGVALSGTIDGEAKNAVFKFGTNGHGKFLT